MFGREFSVCFLWEARCPTGYTVKFYRSKGKAYKTRAYFLLSLFSEGVLLGWKFVNYEMARLTFQTI